jgi:hypothetical protein
VRVREFNIINTMATSKRTSIEPPITKEPLLLKCGKANNFIAWRYEMQDRCTAEYGRLASVLKTNSPYLPPAVKPEDYMPEDAAGMSQTNIGLLRLEAEKARSKEVRGLKVELPKLYGTLMMSISRESREELRNHPGFQVADLEQDANLLWTIILESHLTAVHGVGHAKTAIDKNILRTKLASLKQGNLSLAEFKKCYDEGTETLKAAGIDVLDGEESGRFRCQVGH